MADRPFLSFLQAVSSAVFLAVTILAAGANGQCNGTRMSLTATYNTTSLPSPYYFDLYPRNTNCSWLLQTTLPYDTISIFIISLTFENICSRARLEIFDGDLMSSPRLARLCGSISYRAFNSSGPRALISFTSEIPGILESFDIVYNAESPWDSITTTTSPLTTPNPACVAESQTTLYAWTFPMYLTSPNYRNINIVYSSCRWRLSSFDGPVKLVVKQLNIECTNTLEIFDGGSSYSRRLARLCGNIVDKTYNSTGSSLFLSFSGLDGMFGRYGFQIQYYTQPSATTTTDAPWWMPRTTTRMPMTTTTTASTRPPTRLTASSNYVMYFTSPSYPDPYPANANYTWLIQTETFGYNVMLAVENFRLEDSSNCTFDRLEIFDGASKYSPRLARLCGNLFTRTFYSSGSTAFVSFTSDVSIQESGFSITYSAVRSGVTTTTTPLPWLTTTPLPWWTTTPLPWWNTTPLPWWTTTPLPWWTTKPLTTSGGSTSSTCIKGGFGGVTLSAEYLNAKYIEWPNYLYYDSNYSNNADCAWRLLAELNYVIHVSVIKMDLEYDVNCAYDAVTLYMIEDASQKLNSSKIAKLCSHDGSKNDYYSSGSNMYITFTSDSSTAGTGFRLMYEAVRASDIPASSTSSFSSVMVGVIVVGVVVGVIVIAVLSALMIRYNSKRRQACRRQAARRPRAALTERVQAPPPYTTVSSQFVCGGIVLGPRYGPPAVGERLHNGYNNPGYAADTEDYGPPPAYADLLVLGHILPAVDRNNDSSCSVSAAPSAPLCTSSAEARGAVGGSDTASAIPVSLDPNRLSFPLPPSYDDVMQVTGASSPLPLPVK